ncbi:MAG TPA: MBL fold metallo-hydrolase [Ktedonobacteraceae bacterium]|jgi:glyoxylase-like metal-dependent hydrolase (beta-lactamase superfamily II)|nr:MBL fold metallo-hydrolase [Ktedonobacteraceae bacterium]
MTRWQYTKGLHDLGNSLYAYLQPDGTWGWSNAGLIVDGEATLLVDTLFDLKLTQDMLDTMRKAVPASSHIDMVVNTHANGDHCYGNQLVSGAKIIASRQAAEEMVAGIKPEMFVQLLDNASSLGPLGVFMKHAFSAFDFHNITLTPPNETFEGEKTLKVGNKEVRLIEVGPAHTLGDTLVYVPGDRAVFTGDILFIGGHPIMWAGPTRNWLRACDRILAMDVETIVPGHGPLTDKKGVAEVKGYLEYIYDEARKRYEAGMPAAEAARDIPLDKYATWTDGERIAVNVASIYRELSGETGHANTVELLTQMGRLLEEQANNPK